MSYRTKSHTIYNARRLASQCRKKFAAVFTFTRRLCLSHKETHLLDFTRIEECPKGVSHLATSSSLSVFLFPFIHNFPCLGHHISLQLRTFYTVFLVNMGSRTVEFLERSILERGFKWSNQCVVQVAYFAFIKVD